MAVLMSLLLSFALSAGQAVPPPATIEGDWIGTLAVGGTSLRLAFHVTRDAGGQLTGVMDSLDQGALGIKIETVSVTGDVVRFQLKVPAAVFEGRLSTDGAQISGAWNQGASLPLVLSRGKAERAKRPQEPVRPYPYRDEEVTYRNVAAGITFAGTLTLPRATTPVAAAILISGSGAEDRDETVFGHKPFLILADYLTRNGIAVLRVDDRGVGGSSGRTSTATSEDFAGDALAGIEYLKTRREIDPARIGLIGHSEGGLIAPLAASRSSGVAFVVLMAGPGLPGDELLYLQAAAIAKANGASDAMIAANRAVQERIITIVKNERDAAALGARLKVVRDEMLAPVPDAQKPAVGAELQAQIDMASTPWFRYFVSYDPRRALSQVKCPVLAITGELDLQVPFAPNLDAMGTALFAGGNKNVTLIHQPSLNHLFQTARTGSPAEYSRIEETIAPAALNTITEWIQKTTGRR